MIGYSERRNAMIKSNVAKIVSMPIRIIMTKKITDQMLLPGSILIIAG